ncbi:MAG: hypothetical protein J0L92_09405 [Deltaproteobacteria bacterium]|nr:hypothetical protein [Deltaproteobacteria bacterium]
MTEHSSAAHALFDRDEIREVLETSFYRTEPAPIEPVAKSKRPGVARAGKTSAGRKTARKPKPDHYEILCISMYVEDLASLDGKVEALKQRGHRRMTRSALIRYALERLAIEDVPRPSI